jgi:UDP-N-acetylmuramoyl-L-alanyl-D-glutamate--2,6-diaminopimelate ligase
MIRPLNLPKVSFAAIADLLNASNSEIYQSDLVITGIAQDASEIQPGDIFVAIQGQKKHGIEFLDIAIKNGAVAMITDTKGENSKLPTIYLDNPRKLVGLIAAHIYEDPSANMFTVGITGTNGKTTVTTLLHQIWQSANWDSGLIGTINTQINHETMPSIHTTPEASPLQALFATMRERHLRAVAMEVSSHSLVQHRVAGTHFKVAGFTNLTQDHLDYHGDMESYFNAKASLFNYGLSEQAVINIDDHYGVRLARNIEIPINTISRLNKADWRYEEIAKFGKTTEVKIRGPQGVLIEGTTNLIGDFNLDNLLMAVAIAVISGVDPIEIGTNLHKYTGAPGRLELVEVGQRFLAFVDYAHTPDAVTNVLNTARALTKGKLIAVLGCGGDRDRSKRPLMGQALLLADHPIFTSDNPRSESPDLILNEMLAGVADSKERVEVIADRRLAIKRAIELADERDVVAILGKGHEIGQEIAGTKYPFDDRLVLAEAIAGLK